MHSFHNIHTHINELEDTTYIRNTTNLKRINIQPYQCCSYKEFRLGLHLNMCFKLQSNIFTGGR